MFATKDTVKHQIYIDLFPINSNFSYNISKVNCSKTAPMPVMLHPTVDIAETVSSAYKDIPSLSSTKQEMRSNLPDLLPWIK